MRARGLAFAGVLALVSSACKKDNPNYCADAGKALGFNCAALAEAGAGKPDGAHQGDAGDASDASEVGGDALTDVSDVKAPLCTNDDQCPADGGTPACGTSDAGAKCVECTMSPHCKGSKSVCDKVAQKCVECLGTEAASGTECTVSGKSVCDTMTQKCVGCVNNSHCAAAAPICDATTKSCRTCTADSECAGVAPGICVDWDGHCATNAEVAFLDRGGTCDTSKSMFCMSAPAVGALTADKPILLVSGTMPVSAITITGSAPSQILIVGRGGASVGAGAGDTAGVAVDGTRKLWVRDLKISGGTVGVLASAMAELHLTRCTIVGNGAGGIRTISSSFFITNSIIAANSQGDATGAVSWAGARLGDVPAGGVGRFENNTVVDNLQVGVACSTPYDITTDIIHGNIGSESVNCGLANCCGTGDPDPKLDASYHLMAGSPCIDKIAATMMTLTVDIQGQPRPAPPNGILDCGADELVP